MDWGLEGHQQQSADSAMGLSVFLELLRCKFQRRTILPRVLRCSMSCLNSTAPTQKFSVPRQVLLNSCHDHAPVLRQCRDEHGFLSSNVFWGLTGIEFEVHVARALGFACPVLAGLVRLLKVIYTMLYIFFILFHASCLSARQYFSPGGTVLRGIPRLNHSP